MKPDDRILEKQLKRIIRGESSDSELLANHWRGLGRTGNQIVIRALNRADAWESFANYATQQPALRELAEGLAMLAKQAIKIIQQIESSRPEDWQNLRDEIRTNEDLFDTTLIMLETSNNESAAEFVNSLLDRGFNKEQETRVRKLLYHFRQKGIRPEVEAAGFQTVRELFFFGENKLPLWQPVLYFRPHSGFASNGDLLILRIIEGSETAPAEQQRNIALNQSSMKRLAERYSAQLSRQLGVEVQFHAVEAVHARFVLRRSAELIPDSSAAKPLQDFLKFIGPEPAKNPFESLNKSDTSSSDLFLREAYFSHWTLNPHDIEEYLSQLAVLERGPIILTGSSLAAKKMEIRSSFFQKVFTDHERSIWAFAFQKAAFYLQQSNPEVSASTIHWADQLHNPELQPEDIEIARALFDRTVELVTRQQKARQEEERKTSLIMTPDEFRESKRKT
jgi:hypothetical protein